MEAPEHMESSVTNKLEKLYQEHFHLAKELEAASRAHFYASREAAATQNALIKAQGKINTLLLDINKYTRGA